MTARTGALSLMAAALTMASAFVSFRAIASVVGVDAFGVWALVIAALFPLRFADLSLNVSVLRYLGAIDGVPSRAFVARTLVTAMAINVVAFAACATMSLVVAPPLIRGSMTTARYDAAFTLMPYVIAVSGAQLISATFGAAMLGLHRFRTSYLINIAGAVAQITLIYPLAARAGLIGYAGLQIAIWLAQAVAALVAVEAATRGAPAGDRERFSARALLALAFKFNFSGLLATLIEPTAKLLLGRYGTLGLVGTYEVVFRIFQQARNVGIAPLQPMSIAMIRQRVANPAAFQRTYHRALAFCLGLAAVCIAGSVPGIWLFRDLLKLRDPLLPAVMLAVGTGTAVSLMSVPAFFASVASGDVRPVALGTAAFLITTFCAGHLAGMAGGGGGAILAVVAASYTVASVVTIAVTGRLLGYAPWPHPAAMREDASAALSMVRRRGLGRTERSA